VLAIRLLDYDIPHGGANVLHYTNLRPENC